MMREATILLTAMMMLSVGCDKTKETQPDALPTETTRGTTPSPETTPPAKPSGTTPEGNAATGDTTQKEIALAMGCAEDKLTADGCSTCAGKWSFDGDDDSGIVQSLTLRPGKYTDSGKEQVYITYFGCGDRAGGDSHNVLLEKDGDTWSIVRRSTYKDNQTCEFLKQADGIEHVLCVITSGGQGVEYRELTSPAFSSFKGFDATSGSPSEITFDDYLGLTFAGTTNEELEPDGDGVLPPAEPVTIDSVEDLNGDGSQDARVTIGKEKRLLIVDPKAKTMTLKKP